MEKSWNFVVKCQFGCLWHSFFFLARSINIDQISAQQVLQGSHGHWKIWKMAKKDSMHGKIMEFEK